MKSIKLTLFTVLLLPVLAAGALAQESKVAPESTFEITLHVVSASRGSGTDVPDDVAATARAALTGLGLGKFELAGRYLLRTSNSAEYKGPQTSVPAPEWGFRNIRRAADDPRAIIVDGFRFVTRAVVPTPEKGGGQGNFMTDWYGINNLRFRLVEGATTVVGTIENGNPGGINLILIKIRSVD